MVEEHTERKLAAILAADVVGYSRLMGADEEGTLARLQGASARARRAARSPRTGAASSSAPATACWSISPAPVEAVRCADRDPVGHGRAQPRRRRGAAHRVPHRHQPRRRDQSKATTSTATGSTSRRGWRASPSRAPIYVSRAVARLRPRQGRDRARGSGRKAAQEHRQAGAGLPRRDAGSAGGRAAAGSAAARAGQAVDRRAAVRAT